MAMTFSGGCTCGAIRYECSADPLMSVNCHCRDCQRASGSAFMAVVVVPKDALKIAKGEPKYHAVRADSGNMVSRGFCPECGAPLFTKLSAMPDIMAIKVGSLDDPSWYRPTMDIYTASAQPWDYMNPDVPKVPKMPQM